MNDCVTGNFILVTGEAFDDYLLCVLSDGHDGSHDSSTGSEWEDWQGLDRDDPRYILWLNVTPEMDAGEDWDDGGDNEGTA